MKTAELSWIDHTPFSTQFEDIYFSKESGMEETRYVFIEHNQLVSRWQALEKTAQFTIGETGFGTGLNCLVAMNLWLQYAPETARLHLMSTEKYPLTPSALKAALAHWPALKQESEALIQQYCFLNHGGHRLELIEKRVFLTLLIGDIQDTLPQMDAQVNAWFLDGFSPAKNPEMWQPTVLTEIARLSAPNATFSTFTSAGFVKRGLETVGFEVRKSPGFGRKREMLSGFLRPIDNVTPAYVFSRRQTTPAAWYRFPPPSTYAPNTVKKAIVIGGGLAGTSTAASLAKRGWNVTLFEQHSSLAQEASGNRQGILYPKLSAHFPPLSQLILSGYCDILRRLPTLLEEGGLRWHRCGVLQRATSPRERTRADALLAWNATLPDSFQLMQTHPEGILFQEAGWVHPPALCAALAKTKGITLQTGKRVQSLEKRDQGWRVHLNTGEWAEAEVVVLANALEAKHFDQTAWLPIKPIRGQISYLNSTADSEAFQHVICGEGYCAPAYEGIHTLGATFGIDDAQMDVRQADHQHNLALLKTDAPDWWQALGGEQVSIEALQGRAALRITTPDYLPLIGPIAQKEVFDTAYAHLALDSKLRIERPCPYWEGLYVNTAHGSRGLITGLLSGEVIASWIEHEPFPLSRSLMEAVHPSRFLIRFLAKKNEG